MGHYTSHQSSVQQTADMATHQDEESNQTQHMADDTVEERMTHTINSELAARNVIHE